MFSFFSFFLFYFFLKKRYVFIFCYLLFLDKRNEFGVSLEILQTDSKFGPNSYVFMFFLFYFFFEKRNEFGVSLEIIQTLSKLTPNSIQTQMISCFIVFPFIVFSFLFGKDKRLWSEFGDSPNSLQTRSKLICFQIFLFFFVLFYLLFFYFFGKRGMSLE